MSTTKTLSESHPIKTFLETTSVKGVPRMMKSQSVTLCLLWFTSVVLGAGIAAYFLAKLFILYFSYKVTVSIEEKHVTDIGFPSLTLCNLDPLANTNTSAEQLQQALNMYNQYIKTGNNSRDDNKYLLADAIDTATLFVNFVYDRHPRLHARNFIVTCLWDTNVWDTEDDCLLTMAMRVYEAQYGYCFTFEPPQTTSQVYGFSSILYIDDSIEVTLPSYALQMHRSFATGVVLTAHRKETLPLIDDGIILPAGMSSEVRISVSQREKLPSPFSSCEYTHHLPVSENYAYTHKTCHKLCLQNNVINDCGCVDNLLPAVPSQLQSDINYCRKIDNVQNMEDILRFISNISQCIDHKDESLCYDMCPIECIDHRYELTRSQIEWPHPTSQIAFYDSYIRGKLYEDRFHAYANLSASLGTGNAIPHLHNVLKKETIMRDNFLEASKTIGRRKFQPLFFVYCIVFCTTMYRLTHWN